MDRLRLPVHDEISVSVPEQDTREVTRVMETVMANEFMGVPITATATILGERWHK
jgi:DNA polymerase I-like protein with 3'-5' exonuclease and polymerase domains